MVQGLGVRFRFVFYMCLNLPPFFHGNVFRIVVVVSKVVAIVAGVCACAHCFLADV